MCCENIESTGTGHRPPRIEPQDDPPYRAMPVIIMGPQTGHRATGRPRGVDAAIVFRCGLVMTDALPPTGYLAARIRRMTLTTCRHNSARHDELYKRSRGMCTRYGGVIFGALIPSKCTPTHLTHNTLKLLQVGQDATTRPLTNACKPSERTCGSGLKLRNKAWFEMQR